MWVAASHLQDGRNSHSGSWEARTISATRRAGDQFREGIDDDRPVTAGPEPRTSRRRSAFANRRVPCPGCRDGVDDPQYGNPFSRPLIAS